MLQKVSSSAQLPVAGLVTDNLCKTILRIPRSWGEGLSQIPPIATASLNAMQDLIALIKTLRSLNPDGSASSATQLLPYVTEEAYELLETLPDPTASADTAHPTLVLLESLIPRLLWCVARSEYGTMQLIEGIPAQAQPSTETWATGILRLAVTLVIQTTDASTELDLTTTGPVTPPVDRDWHLQPDADYLSTLQWDQETVTDRGPAPAANWVQAQLDHLTTQLMGTQPSLTPWLEGITADALIPGRGWEAMTLQLKLDFAFMPHPFGPQGQASTMPAIAAELLEPQEYLAQSTGAKSAALADSMADCSVAIVDLPLPAAITTTMVRLADPITLAQFTTFAHQREIVRSLHGVSLQPVSRSPDRLLPLVQAADRLADVNPQRTHTQFCLLQPELLVDELIPKLLWHITQSSFWGMQWLGGMTCRLLSPGQDWHAGLLRLMVVLELQTETEQWCIDLATGRFLSTQSWQTPVGAIAHLQSADYPALIPTDQLHAQLQHSIHTTASEIASLGQGVRVEWLTPEHDWQIGQIYLHTGLEFIPDLF